MKRIFSRLFILTLFLATVVPSSVQAASLRSRNSTLRVIEKHIKDNQPDEALKKITEAENQADSLGIKLHELYWLGIRASELTNKAENEKVYLKQAFDTTKFFNSIKLIFDYGNKCKQALYNVNDGREQSKWQSRIARKLTKYYYNLGIAAKHFYRKRQYADALPYINYYLNAAHNGLVTQTPPQWEAEKPYYAFLGMQCSYLAKKYDSVFQYQPTAARDTMHADIINEILARTSRASNDSARYIQYLLNGMLRFPENRYYYNNIVRILLIQKRAAYLVTLSDSLLRIRPQHRDYWYGKSLALIELKHYNEAINCAGQVIEIDTSAVEPLFHIGFSYCQMADSVRQTKDLSTVAERTERINAYYRKAMPYLEQYKQRRPQAVQKWGPLLYRIYLNLNMGQQFEELNKIMGTQ